MDRLVDSPRFLHTTSSKIQLGSNMGQDPLSGSGSCVFTLATTRTTLLQLESVLHMLPFCWLCEALYAEM